MLLDRPLDRLLEARRAGLHIGERPLNLLDALERLARQQR
jgi:hypothetical protein